MGELLVLAIYYKELDQHIVISGKTYPYRDQIKGLGGRFQAQSKVWLIPHNPDSLNEVRQLCKRVGGGILKTPRTAAPTNPQSVSPAATEGSATRSIDPKADSTEAHTASGWTISELLNRVQLSISQQFPKPIWIIGEVHNLNQRKSAVYFQLADLKEGASKSATLTINATLWQDARRYIEGRQKSKDLTDLLQEGMKIRILAQVNLYRDRASLSLNVVDIDPRYTKGALALQREELLRELRAKGIDRKNATLPLARFPFRVGFISADQSRAKSDFIDQLSIFRCPVELMFVAAQMQGEATIRDVCGAIHHLCQRTCDLIVITRGGGSMADLRWFDNREIALAIANSPVPILAAIGHQDDVCVAEEVAFRREKTPTAAADFIIAHFQQSLQLLEKFSHTLSQQLLACLHRFEQDYDRLMHELRQTAHAVIDKRQQGLQRLSLQLMQNFQSTQLTTGRRLQGLAHELQRNCDSRVMQLNRSMEVMVNRMHQSIDQFLHLRQQAQQKLHYEWQANMRAALSRQEQSLLQLESQLAAQDPKPWLEKGWTQLFSGSKLIRSIEQTETGDQLEARLQDGRLSLTVHSKQAREKQSPKTGDEHP